MRIWWRFRTMSMFAMLTLILVAFGSVVSALFMNSWMIGAMIMIVVSLIVCFISYYKSKDLALRSARARIVTEDECPRLYSIVKEVAEKAGLPMPEVGISPDMSPNAFATGRNPQNAAVVCTEGILQMLPDDELRGVIAHEMSHVKNRDILVMSIASALASIISYLARMAMWMAIMTPSSNSKDDNSKIIMIAIAIAAQILVPIAALIIQLGISRSREYLADETGAIIIQDPRALARALDHIERGNDYIQAHQTKSRSRDRNNPANDYDYAHMWIANPLKKGSLISRMFSTHPPMSERIERLNMMADKMGL